MQRGDSTVGSSIAVDEQERRAERCCGKLEIQQQAQADL